MASSPYSYNSERVGRRRLPDNKQYRADLQGRSDIILSAMQDLLASNYPKTPNSNMGVSFRSYAREFAREQQSIELINNDKIFTQTRVQFLQQILGERLFLGGNVTLPNYNDVSYRNYLIAIKDACLKGSSKETIEGIVSTFTQQTVNLKELYLEARKPGSAYGLTDTNKMILEVFVDDLAAGVDLATLSTQINFFINLVKPAHVLYDTKLIWTETIDINKTHDLYFGDTGGGCVPIYLYNSFNDKVILATQIVVVEPAAPITLSGTHTGLSYPIPGQYYRIDSIHPEDLTLYLENGTKVIVEPGINGTKLFGVNGRTIMFDDLHIDQYIYITYLVIPGDFQFYWMPPDLVTNYDSRFYKDVFRKPAFQENVKKLMDIKGRFPVQIRTTETTLCDRWVQDALQPMYEDLRKNCKDLPEHRRVYTVDLANRMWTPRYTWENFQGAYLGREKTGDTFSYTMPYAPLTDGSGSDALPSNIGVYRDTTAIYGAVESVDTTTAFISLFNTTDYWDASGGGVPFTGQELTFNYFYKTDSSADSSASSTYLFGISQWQLPKVPVSNGESTNFLALPSDVTVLVDGTEIPDAVAYLEPILGHVGLQSSKDFWVASPLGRAPVVGDQITFDYFQSGSTYYAMLFDDIARGLDDSMTLDGADGTSDPARAPAPTYANPQIGYKFRADLLHHASVLNSPDTLLLNNYQKPATRASIANRQDTLNHYNYFFSPEHLYDADTNIVLNDDYLNKADAPLLLLGPGTPPFQKTFAYQPKLINERKLHEIRQHHHPLMYSDLLLKEYQYGDDQITLSSICDQAGYSFKIGYKETLGSLEECEQWLLFDTAVVDFKEITIPGERIGVANLRTPAKRLRRNLILRETEPSNITSTTYSTYLASEAMHSIFNLPQTISYPMPPAVPGIFEPVTASSETVAFPALPVMRDALTLATISDIIVKVNGDRVYGLIDTFDPVTGVIEIFPPSSHGLTIEHRQLTQQEVDSQFIRLHHTPSQCLSGNPLNPTMVTLNIEGGTTQLYGYDFYVEDNELSWNGGPLVGLLSAGDILVVSYLQSNIADSTISFTYNIKSTGFVNVMDEVRSRVFDRDYVFPAYCFDGYETKIQINYREYVNFVSDYSAGIKFKYLNKDTYQIEEHIFTGPVFESFNPNEDEISSPDSFPNALVKINNFASPGDPRLISGYDFLNADAIRIRKKTVRELLPDRTYRTTKITEALPV